MIRRLKNIKNINIKKVFCVVTPPTGERSKVNKKKYIKCIKEEALENNISLIETDDVAIIIDIWGTHGNIYADLDRLIHPILDALEGIAYNEDKQITALQINLLRPGDIHPINQMLIGFQAMAKTGKKGDKIFISIGQVEKEK